MPTPESARVPITKPAGQARRAPQGRPEDSGDRRSEQFVRGGRGARVGPRIGRNGCRAGQVAWQGHGKAGLRMRHTDALAGAELAAVRHHRRAAVGRHATGGVMAGGRWLGLFVAGHGSISRKALCMPVALMHLHPGSSHVRGRCGSARPIEDQANAQQHTQEGRSSPHQSTLHLGNPGRMMVLQRSASCPRGCGPALSDPCRGF